MGLTGKYNFTGIQKMGIASFRIALSMSPYTSWFIKVPGSDYAISLIVNWLANKGLLVLNIGAIEVSGEFDQHALDSAMDEALKQIIDQGGRDKLTIEQKKAIDDEVIKAARKFIVIGNP